MLESIKSFFVYNKKEVIKHFLIAELDDLTSEIKENYEYIRTLEEKRKKVQLMVFGN